MLVVIENLLNREEAERIADSLSGAQWEDGRKTAGSIARQAKWNEQVSTQCDIGTKYSALVQRKLEEHPLFVSAALPVGSAPLRFNRYQAGGHYGAHVDNAFLRSDERFGLLRADVSTTIFLSAPESYEGGELVIEGPFGAQEVKLEAGDAVLYPSTSLHCVNPVTAGARIAGILWVQSMIRSGEKRALLFDLDQSIQAVTRELGADHPETSRLTGVYHNLLRIWGDT